MTQWRWKWCVMNSNDDSDNHNSRSNSLKSVLWRHGLWRVSGIPYGSALRSPSGPAQQIHTSHEGQHMVAAQHMESQVALYLIVSLPPPQDGLLSSFFPPLLLICLKLQIKRVSFVLICILISLAFSHCILVCPFSCRFVVPFPVSLVCMGDFWYQWVVWVWIAKKRADRQ